MIVRLWIEPHREQGLRARITQTLDTMAGEHSVSVAKSVEDICAVVKEWVDEFAGPRPLNGNGQVDGFLS